MTTTIDPQALARQAQEWLDAHPLMPLSIDDTTYAWMTGYEMGITHGLRLAAQEQHAAAVHRVAAAHVLSNADIPTHTDLVRLRRDRTRGTARQHATRAGVPWPRQTGDPAA